MGKVNAAIVSYYMDNINPKTVELQGKVVEKYNVSQYPHYRIRADLRPGAAMDYVWCLNGVKAGVYAEAQIEKKIDHDVLVFLDIDAVPLSEEALDILVNKANEGYVVGNIQRSNHIQNDQHVFAAPSLVAIRRDVFEKIGAPSALENRRSDVAEEWTFAAEEAGVPVYLYMPLRYDRKPTECDSWALKDGMPVYGQGTTFGDSDGKDLFFHNFQIFHPGQQENFWRKCEEILNG